MISTGVLDATKVGGRWLVDPASIERRDRCANPVGRPFSEANAWGLLWVADGKEPDWLSPSALSRVRRRLREFGLVALAPRLRTRAIVRRFRAHPSDVERLAAEENVVRSGVSTIQEHDLLLAVPGRVEAYVRERDLKELVLRYALQSDSAKPNVLLRVVSGIWPFEEADHVASISVVGVDLSTSDEARTRREGLRILEGVEDGWST